MATTTTVLGPPKGPTHVPAAVEPAAAGSPPPRQPPWHQKSPVGRNAAMRDLWREELKEGLYGHVERVLRRSRVCQRPPTIDRSDAPEEAAGQNAPRGPIGLAERPSYTHRGPTTPSGGGTAPPCALAASRQWVFAMGHDEGRAPGLVLWRSRAYFMLRKP